MLDSVSLTPVDPSDPPIDPPAEPQEYAQCTSIPTTLTSAETINFPVEYSANESRDVVVELWQNGAYLTQNRVTVDAGTGTANVPISLSPAPSGSNFLVKGGIRPIGASWQSAIDACSQANVTIEVEPIDPPIDPPVDQAEFAQCSSIPATLTSASTITIPVEYGANESRDVVVELWQNGTYLTQNRITVDAGTGTANVPISLSPPPSGSNFLIKGDVRPIGTAWQSAIDSCSKPNVSIQATTSGCNIDWTSPNKSITRSTLNFVSEPIDIACASSVTISMDVEGRTPQVMENSDFLNIYYSVDGGQQVAVSENTDGFALKNISANNIQGNSVVLYINGQTSWTNETYLISNISVSN